MSNSKPLRDFIGVAPGLIDDRPEREPEELDGAYRERNQVVAALIRSNGWPTWITDAPDAPGWWIVYAESPVGQVSWHVGPSDQDVFYGFQKAPIVPWDGHTTEEKYQRLATLGAGHHAPGDFHDYGRLVCTVCGQYGQINVSIVPRYESEVR